MAPHRYWRVYITANYGNDVNWTQLAEVEFRATAGGADQASGGAAIGSSTQGSGYEIANAFDNTDAVWMTSLGGALPSWIGYDFGAGVTVSVAQVMLKSGGAPARFPTAGKIQYSDNSSTWADEWSFTNINGGATVSAFTSWTTVPDGGGGALQWQVNCGSTVAITGWNNDAAPDPSTLSNLVTSTGGASTAGYYCDVWDIAKTDGIGHADLPSDVGVSYLKWYGAGRTLRFTGLDNAKTYTVTLYSTAPGAVSNDWTVAGSTKALARGGKAQWTGLTPSSGVLEFTSASSTNGTDVTLSAALINEGAPLQGGGGGSSRRLRRRLGLRMGGF